jgi:hypothetical protein
MEHTAINIHVHGTYRHKHLLNQLGPTATTRVHNPRGHGTFLDSRAGAVKHCTQSLMPHFVLARLGGSWRVRNRACVV